MSVPVAEERFDWRGPAVTTRQKSPFRKLFEQIVPPKGQKVLPTSSGLLLIFIGLTLGLAAYNTENNILFAALALLIASLVLSGIVCWGNMLSARWRLETSGTFRVGEEGIAAVVVENARQRFPLFCLSFGLSSDALNAQRRVYLKERLDPGESSKLLWRFKPAHRVKGHLRIVDAVSSFPFGFLSKYLAGEVEVPIIVWPARIAYTRYRSPGVAGSLQGQSSKKKGGSGELIGLRPYARGDAPRDIHWKVSARQGRPIVKQNAAETQALYRMIVDPSDYLWQDSECFERMCSLATTMAEDLFLDSKLDACIIVGGPSVKVQRVTDLETFFDAMAELKPSHGEGQTQNGYIVNRIVFKPTSNGGVGAYVNEFQIAQA